MKTFDDMLEYELGEEVQLFNAPRQNPRNCFETGTNCNYPIDIGDITAWKEIVFPKEN